MLYFIWIRPSENVFSFYLIAIWSHTQWWTLYIFRTTSVSVKKQGVKIIYLWLKGECSLVRCDSSLTYLLFLSKFVPKLTFYSIVRIWKGSPLEIYPSSPSSSQSLVSQKQISSNTDARLNLLLQFQGNSEYHTANILTCCMHRDNNNSMEFIIFQLKAKLKWNTQHQHNCLTTNLLSFL